MPDPGHSTYQLVYSLFNAPFPVACAYWKTGTLTTERTLVMLIKRELEEVFSKYRYRVPSHGVWRLNLLMLLHVSALHF